MTIDEEFFDDEETDETEEERQARLDTEVVLDELSAKFVKQLIDKLMLLVDEISGHPLYPYQRPLSRRIIESVVIGDGATITACFARQSGKSETVANTVAMLMIILPVLAKVYPDLLGRFKNGLWVGAFAPVDDQADTLFGRIVSRITSERALAIMQDPDINDSIKARGRTLTLKSGSLVRRQTCHPRAIIEGRTYHLILIDEAQGADERMVNKSIAPMGASTNATLVMTGTPSYEKGVFYDTIQHNKRMATRRGQRQNHFEADWKAAAKSNPLYGRAIKREMLRLGVDSDEFKLSYRLIWLLEKGMFTTTETIDSLGDKSMEVVKVWHKTPVVVGIDPARKQDSTVVTVVWVDWDRPDEFGMYEHRILNWLDLEGMDWENQYYRIVDFLANYNIHAIGVDVGGVGDAVASRLKVLMPRANIVEMSSTQAEQSKRWRYLNQLLERRLIGWPAHAKTRRLRTYKKFRQQMLDLQVDFKGPHMLAAAPDQSGAADDYCDSLAIACYLSAESALPQVEVTSNPFYGRR